MVPGELSLKLEAELRRGKLTGRVNFRDSDEGIRFRSSAITALAVSGGLASVRGHGTTSLGAHLSFEATLDTTNRTLTFQLGSSDSAAAFRIDKRGKIRLRGSCPSEDKPTLVLDASARVSGTIGPAGGSLASGDMTLTIPAGALSDDTTITLTPLVDLAGTPLAGTLIGGAKLEPEGLRFLRPAVLVFAAPPSVPVADVIGFGTAGDASQLHLQPRTVSGDTISLRLWHFSAAGASSGGSGAASAVQARPPSSAEQRALQRIAIAQPACELEEAQGIFGGAACDHLREESVRALFDWYTTTVVPGLDQAGAASAFRAEAALAEWLAWQAEVALVFHDDPAGTPQCGTLQNECDQAHASATAAVAAHAQQRLTNCTGTSLTSQLRDIARISDFSGAGAIDLTSVGLPDATNGELLRACAHLEITVVDFPAVAALNAANTLRGRVTVDVFSGPDRTDVPFTFTVDGAGVPVAADGTFQSTLSPTVPGLALNVALEAEAIDPSLQTPSFSTIAALTRPTRERLLLQAMGSTTVPAGGTVGLRVLVAGDGMSSAVVPLTVGGPGSVSPSSITTDAQGEALATYNAPGDGVVSNATVTAALSDGAAASVPITITVPVTVALNPTTVVLTAGATQEFTATVTGSLLGVTWTASGGAIVVTGSHTARFEAGTTPGSFSVTAMSIADPASSATATVVIQPPLGGTVQLVSAGGCTLTAAHGMGLRAFPGGSVLIDTRDEHSDCSSEGAVDSFDLESFAAASEGDVAIGSGVANANSVLLLDTTSTTLSATASGLAEVSSSGGGAEGVFGTAIATSTFGLTFDVVDAPLSYDLVVDLTVGLGNPCSTSLVRTSPTPATIADGTVDISQRGSLPPGRYELKAQCLDVSSATPGGVSSALAVFSVQLHLGP